VVRKTLGVDIDNVISVTDPAIRRLLRDTFGISLAQEQVVHYAYHRCGITREQEHRVLELFHDVACTELDVVPGAVEALKVLKPRYNVILVTSRNLVIREKTRDWLRANDIRHDSLVFESAKHTTNHSFDFFIEDNGESALSLAEAGIHTFLFDYPWNRYVDAHPKISRVHGWDEVLAALS
jgi:uncharacterized HAD superfamily protein